MEREELESRAGEVARMGARVVITGMWAWAEFPDKPQPEVLDHLKTHGWRWAHKKAMWYLAGRPGASKRGMSWMHITTKYGEKELQTA